MLLEVPKFHPYCHKIGLENFYKISRTYKEVIGLGKFDHFCINIASPDKKMVFMSCNPIVALELVKSGLYLFDGTLSPTVYNKKDFCFWEDEYVPKYLEEIKKIKEYKFKINSGCIFTKKINGFVLIYSFGTKGIKEDFEEEVKNCKEDYLAIGDHCYSLIRDVYGSYLSMGSPPLLTEKIDESQSFL